MRYFTLTAAIAAAISISACQTTGSDALFTGIAADKIAPIVDVADPTLAAGGTVGVPGAPGVSGVPGIPGVSAPVMTPAMSLAAAEIRASGANPVCGQFNMNSLAYAANPKSALPGRGIIKTIARGVIAGAAGGAVTELGIGSAFAESMVAGTVNQVVYNASEPVIDSVLPDGDNSGRAEEISSAAERLSCPNPTTFLKGLSKTDAKALLAMLNAEFSAANAATSAASEIVQ